VRRRGTFSGRILLPVKDGTNMLFDLQKKRLRWRRVAVYHPVRIDVDVATTDSSRSRPDSLNSCQPGMRVHLRREPTSPDHHAVALIIDGGRRIGRLPADVAAWVAPLLDSGMAAFDAEIWSVEMDGNGPSVENDGNGPSAESDGNGPSVENNGNRRDPHAPACRLMLTHHELAPTPRRSLAAWLPADWRPFSKRSSPRSVEA
jgi:HIRAN domain